MLLLARVTDPRQRVVDATTYTYNIRSWTTDISGSRFSENLYYNANTAGLPSFTPSYNGNIAGMQWSVTNESGNRAYSFTYDGLNRLTDAIYTGFSGGVINGTQNRYDEHFGFDKMGNTTSFTRNGLLSSSGGYGAIDNLTFTYNGNQKVKITDAGTNGIFYGDEEFVQNGTNTGNSCAYDTNGNRLYDSNSNIWGIRYNTLNLPDAMQFYQGHQTNYTYSASGAKLKVIDKTAPAGVVLPVTSLNTILSNPSVSTTTTTDYVRNMIYENGALKRILTPVGYWEAGTYYYFLKDHLGSNRVVINGSGGIAETSSYYPSGMRFGESAVNGGSVQPYRHTGHEMQEMHGLNWIDNLARFRTVSDGSGFTGVDPLAEKYYSISPYAYCLNNPVKFVDLDGRVVRFAPGVSAQFKKDYMAAGHALKTHSSGNFMRTLEKSKTVYTIAESNSLYSRFNGKTNTLTWASRAMMLTTNGTSVSPTTILNHELDHAAQKDQNPGQQTIDGNKESIDYKNKEDERVITGSEQQTAKNLKEIKEGEVTRTDHGGTLYKTDSPTSTEITTQLTVTAPKKEKKK